MNELLNTLFGLDGLGFGTPDAVLTFERPLPAWAWALLALLAIALGVWTYRNLPGGPARRATLGVLRGAIIALLALLAAGPSLRLDQSRTERDRVYVLVDRSASMGVPDAPDRQRRGTQASNALIAAGPALTQRAQQSDVAYWSFGSSANQLPEAPIASPNDDPNTPGDPATRLGAALSATLDAARGAPIGGIVLLTDGRSTDRIPPEVLRRLEADRVPIFPVPLGSPDPVRSVSIERAESPGVAFIRDSVPIRARVAWSGELAPGTKAQLVDRSTGRVLDETSVEPGDAPNAWVTLNVKPEEAGAMDLEVRLSGLDAAQGLPDPSRPDPSLDIDPEDNAQRVPLQVIDRPIRALYVDGSPRWEHRYVKNLLLREPSIDASILLLASGRRYIQEGDTLIARLPVSPEDWDTFDVIILGDLSGELFGSEQLAQLTEHIAQRGAGVLWMAGPGSTPASWLDTPASPLMPVTGADLGAWSEPVTAIATPEADRLGVLRTSDDGEGWNERLSDPSAGWTRLQWALDLGPNALKPGAAVLANARGIASGQERPLVVVMRYGSGRTALVGTDEIWRWRYGRGETVPERFWVPLIRMLARGRVEAALGAGVLRVRPEQPQPGVPALIELEVFDQDAVDRLPERVRAQIVRADGRRDEIELRGEGSTRTGEWVPDAPGSFRVELAGAPPELGTLETVTRVVEPGDERANLNTDHPSLAALAELTGGRIVPASDIARLNEWMPNRSRVHAGTPIIETLWDRWAVLIGLLGLFTLEWIARRLMRLA
jgi:hypothetical protein